MNKSAIPIALLILLGALHWAFFLGPTDRPWAGPKFSIEDWPKEYRYYEVLQQAVREGRVPLYISRPIHTRKFLALPETLWSPQLLLLGVLGIGPFVVVNTLLLYAAGCAGLLRLRRRYGLGLPAFAVLFLAFMLNGHVTAHLAVGHSMWTGYFLLPLFALPVLDLVEGRSTRATPLFIALVLFVILLQGAFHVFVWCVILLGLLALLSFPLLPPVLRVLAWTAGLGACRLAPAYFLQNRKEQTFLSGVPSLASFWHGLFTVRDPRQAQEGGAFAALSWWELDFYLGAIGVLWLVVFGLLLRFGPHDRAHWRRPGLDGALLLLALLAAGDLYALVNRLPLPLLSAQRVSSRFLVLPLVFLMILAAARLEQWLRDAHPALSRLTLVAIALFAASLGTHSAVWRVARLETILPPRRGNLQMSISSRDDVPDSPMERAYRATVPLSAAISLGTLVAVGVRLRRLRKEPLPAVAPTGQSPPAPPNTEG